MSGPTVEAMPDTAAEKASRAECWHHSSLSDIEGCPRLYAATHILDWPRPTKLNALAGTIYHAAVEADQGARLTGEERPTLEDSVAYAHGLLWAAVDDIDPEALARYRPSQVTAKSAPTGTDALIAEVTQALTSYYTKPTRAEDGTLTGPTIRELLEDLEPVSLETYARAAFVPGARDIAGTWDAVYRRRDGRLVVVDHKTAGGFGTTYHPSGDQVRPQGTVYATILTVTGASVELPEVVVAVVLRRPGLRETTEAARWISYTPNLRDVEVLRDRVLAAEATVTAAEYPTNPHYLWCRTCVFRPDCQDNPTGPLLLPWPQLKELA